MKSIKNKKLNDKNTNLPIEKQIKNTKVKHPS